MKGKKISSIVLLVLGIFLLLIGIAGSITRGGISSLVLIFEIVVGLCGIPLIIAGVNGLNKASPKACVGSGVAALILLIVGIVLGIVSKGAWPVLVVVLILDIWYITAAKKGV